MLSTPLSSLPPLNPFRLGVMGGVVAGEERGMGRVSGGSGRASEEVGGALYIHQAMMKRMVDRNLKRTETAIMYL